jgi:hypothetical protein
MPDSNAILAIRCMSWYVKYPAVSVTQVRLLHGALLWDFEFAPDGVLGSKPRRGSRETPRQPKEGYTFNVSDL